MHTIHLFSKEDVENQCLYILTEFISHLTSTSTSCSTDDSVQAIGYLVFKALLKRVIGYKLASIIWTLGPLLYIATLTPISIIVIKNLTSPTPPTAYHFHPQLGFIAWFFYYVVPGPFISIATLPRYLRLVKNVILCELKRQ